MHISFARMQSQKKSEKLAQELQKKFSDFKLGNPDLKKDAALCSLVSLAQKNGLKVVNARLCRQKNKSWCTMQEMHTECQGNYDQFVSFFEQLAIHKPLISCKNCDIARIDKDIFAARVLLHAYII